MFCVRDFGGSSKRGIMEGSRLLCLLLTFSALLCIVLAAETFVSTLQTCVAGNREARLQLRVAGNDIPQHRHNSFAYIMDNGRVVAESASERQTLWRAGRSYQEVVVLGTIVQVECSNCKKTGITIAATIDADVAFLPESLDFYFHRVGALLNRGIKPLFPCLYSLASLGGNSEPGKQAGKHL